MRRAVQLNVFFVVLSLAHLTATESTIESVTESEEEDSTIKSQIDLDDGKKFSKLLGANDTYYLEFGSWDNQTWSVSYDNGTQLANYTQDDYSLSKRNEDPKSGTTAKRRWEEPEPSRTEGAQSQMGAAERKESDITERSQWGVPKSSTTGRNWWKKTEFMTTEEVQSRFSTTERNWWEELQSNRWEESKFGNDTEGSNYTEWASEELGPEANNTSYFPFEQEPTSSRQPLLYRNYGDVKDTKDGWHVTLYDENRTPCLKMNLQIVINVYVIRNNPRSRPKGASFIQTFPTSPHDLTVEGECNNGTSLLFISWKTSNLTWHFDQGENGAWSMREVELTVTKPNWFDKYNFCDGPCHRFSLKSGNGSWYDSSMRCRQVNVRLNEEGATTLKAVVFLMDRFRAEPFARNANDFETRIC